MCIKQCSACVKLDPNSKLLLSPDDSCQMDSSVAIETNKMLYLIALLMLLLEVLATVF